MQKIFEKIIEKLEENQTIVFRLQGGKPTQSIDLVKAIEIVEQEAEQYKDFDMVFAKKCVELAEKMNVCDLVAENCRLSNENRFLKLKTDNNSWIPCDGVRLPKENEYVRVTIWCGHEWIGYYRDGKWFVYGADGLAEATVLAWQPTQPYQPKGE